MPSTAENLPNYAQELDSFHRAFEPELRAMIQSLPLDPSATVADVGCGDGFYLPLLAERLNRDGTIIGIDSNAAYLDVARNRMSAIDSRCNVRFEVDDIAHFDQRMPEYDLVWCAQSLMSLPDPLDTLRNLASIILPEGLLAVMENDTLHQLLLPWPCSLELAIRVAEFQELAGEHASAKYYIGRRLSSDLACAGLTPLSCRTLAIDRSTPIDGDLATFVTLYLQKLRERITPHLSRPVRAELLRLIDPTSDDYLLRKPDFTLTWLNILAIARRPE